MENQTLIEILSLQDVTKKQITQFAKESVTTENAAEKLIELARANDFLSQITKTAKEKIQASFVDKERGIKITVSETANINEKNILEKAKTLISDESLQEINEQLVTFDESALSDDLSYALAAYFQALEVKAEIYANIHSLVTAQFGDEDFPKRKTVRVNY